MRLKNIRCSINKPVNKYIEHNFANQTLRYRNYKSNQVADVCSIKGQIGPSLTIN